MKFLSIALLLTSGVSEGSKLIKTNNHLVKNVAKAINFVSGTANFISKNSLATIAACTVVSFSLGHPTITSAAGNSVVASNLFAKAESAIASNLQDYKNLDKEWTSAKKMIAENGNILSKASSSLGEANKQMAGFDEIMSNMIEEDTVANRELSAEIDSLRLSTGMKYAAAQKSSSAIDKPSVTSQLFINAQNDANILEQSEVSLKKFTDAIGPPGSDKIFKKRSDEVLEILTEMVGRADDILSEQKAGTSLMEDGLAANAKSCRDSLYECAQGGSAGVTKFRTGLKEVEDAQTRFTNLRKEISVSLKTFQVIESDLTKENNLLISIIKSDKQWEDKTGLKLKNGKIMTEKVAQKYSNSLKETEKMTKRLSDTNVLLSKDVEKSNKKQVFEELKVVSGLLEKANDSGKTAEDFLRAAQQQGEKEASKYLKFAKRAQPSNTVTASVKTVKEVSVNLAKK